MEKVELSALQKLDSSGKVPPLAPEDLPKFRAEVENFGAALHAAGVSFNEVPFALPEEMDPAGLADAITRFFYKIRDRDGPILSLLWSQITSFAATLHELKPIVEAGERIAADFDRGLGAGLKNAYHNRQHTLEVLACANVLALIDARSDFPIAEEGRLLLLLGALVHDWHHDGGINGDEPFRLEKIAIKSAKPYLTALTPLQQLRLDLIVRTTDVGGPHQFARTALAYQRLCTRMAKSDKRPPAPEALPGYEYLNNLTQPEHALTVEIAALLRDADVLPATGLNADYAALNSSRLRDERNEPYGHADFAAFLNNVISRPRTNYDERPALPEEKQGLFFSFASRPGQYFNPNISDVVRGHAKLMEEMGEEPAPEEEAPAEDEPTVDLSVFEEVKQESHALGQPHGITLEDIVKLQATLKSAGFFESPPFTMALKGPVRTMPGVAPELIARLTVTEQTADTLQRLHGVNGPVMSALVTHLFDTIGLKVTEPIYQAASAIAKEIDEGRGTGTLDDDPAGERNPYHNNHHILDLLLLCDMLGQRASQRGAPASSPLARGLLLLGALVCHWHHTGRGNRVDGQYKTFLLQDRAISFANTHTEVMSKELRASLEILVRSTDPREPYMFAKTSYAFHVGLGPKPDVPPNCEPLSRLLMDPALCTLAARLNDAIFVPYCGLGAAYSARSIVQMGREISQPIDFAFVRKSLIGPMLSRPPYPGEKIPTALLLGQNRVASFTSAEAQAIFNPSMHALLVAQAKVGSSSKPAAAATQPAPKPTVAAPPPVPPPPVVEEEATVLEQAPEPVLAPEPEPAPTPEVIAKPAPPEPEPITTPQQEPPPEPISPEPVAAEPALPVLLEPVPPMVMVPEPIMLLEPEPVEEPEPEPEPQTIITPPPAPPPAPSKPVASAPAKTIERPVVRETIELTAVTPPQQVVRVKAPSQPLIPEDGPSASELIEALKQAPPQPTLVMVPSFPYFKYHPDPITSGVIKPTALQCVACGQVRGFSYYGPIHEATLGEARICPWCIADGLAHAKFGCLFADPQPLLEDGIKPDIIMEVTRRTPGYQSWQRDRWLTHCKDACSFSGDVSVAEAQQAPSTLRRSMCDYYDMSEKAWPTLIARYEPGGDPGIYKFTCRHCGDILYSWDCT